MIIHTYKYKTYTDNNLNMYYRLIMFSYSKHDRWNYSTECMYCTDISQNLKTSVSALLEYKLTSSTIYYDSELI